ncbi:Crp/Fnr family transcriptional regulator [Acinetobacter sp. ANC 5380]|uniref:Crp/Fnr family transcriptional regulator n=1 Tax=Acinetobacter terrae TaxID=2731247 RepID=A0A7Y2W9G2_9GAMM|nr:Crp/Fnr family transcriptional regulator [Acinetobacter terrae]NNH39481.1 Crp/Fnr family transcriptional regulator [Acinetobacter terrae]NNH76341.1 Crp/Fnr family transcriptional regulator [Acinetobacter terrae]
MLSRAEKLQQIFKEDAVFSAFNAQSHQTLLQQVKYLRFLPQQRILRYQQKLDDIYVQLSGRMQIGWLLSDGEFKVSDYVKMYSVFNLVPFLQQKPLNFDFYAIEQVEVAVISGQVFLEQLQQQPQAMWQIIQLLSERMYGLMEKNRYLQTASINQKIARHLMILGQQAIPAIQAPSTIQFKMSQQAFAELLNVSRQTLNKQLQYFIQEHIVEWNYSQIRILDFQRLKQISQL